MDQQCYPLDYWPASTKELFGIKQEFIYRAAPIIKYILDEDVIETFKIIVDKEELLLLSADKLLEVFFGTTENVKRLLEYEYF